MRSGQQSRSQKKQYLGKNKIASAWKRLNYPRTARAGPGSDVCSSTWDRTPLDMEFLSIQGRLLIVVMIKQTVLGITTTAANQDGNCSASYRATC